MYMYACIYIYTHLCTCISRIPSILCWLSPSGRPQELGGCALIRELHVYGTLVAAGREESSRSLTDDRPQHIGALPCGIYVHTHTYIYICIYTHVYTCTYMYIPTYIHTYRHTYIHTGRRDGVCMYMYLHVCIYMYLCMYVCICIGVCVYIYPHVCIRFTCIHVYMYIICGRTYTSVC